ncbi:hypothetical protein C0416_03425 [bacterium]|nr:hypothetical protein [bacterium]
MNMSRKLMTIFVGIVMFTSMALPAGAIFVIEPIIPLIILNPIYVDNASGVDTNAGTKVAPVKTITKAIQIAKAGAAASYQIYVAEGDYRSETFPLNLSSKGISIYGGYYNSFGSRDIANHQTEIMGGANNSIEVVNVNSTISGIKIYNQSGGAGSVITVNTDDANVATNYSVSISEVEIVDCTTLGGGIAVYAENGDNVKIFNNFIHDMSAFGGGILIDGEPTTGEIHHNFLYNNIGFYNIVADKATIYNNIITKGSGVGINLRKNAKAYNNTVVNNNSGIYVASGVTGAEFKNNVIASNTTKAVDIVGSATYDYNVYYGNGSLTNTLAAHDSSCNPMLTNVNSLNENDYALGSTSSCIDKGTEIAIVTNDYFGESRPKDGNDDAFYNTDPGAIEASGDLAAAPGISNAMASPNIFSPNGDGINDTTTISYILNVTSDILVEIYDGTTLIKEVFAGVQSSGTHTVVWNGENTAGDSVIEKIYTFKISATNSESGINYTASITVDYAADEVNCAGFPDVSLSDPLCPAIQYVKDEGIFSGYPDGTFRPNDVINRAETTKVILLGFNVPLLPDDGTNLGFTDVILNAWYMIYLRTGQEAGIVQGYPDGTFKPSQQVNKVEMLKIFLETADVNLSGVVSPSYPYPDTPNNVWYSIYVQYSKDHALVDAASNGNFYPAEGMQRGDVAQLFYRFDQAGL